MNKISIFIQTVYIFLLVSGSVFAFGERTISIGGTSGWRNTYTKTGIVEAASIRPNSVLILSSAAEPSVNSSSSVAGIMGNFSTVSANVHNRDMSISFDEREPGLFRDSVGRYRVTTSAGISTANSTLARVGSGAALFGGSGSQGAVTIVPQSRNALFAPGNRIRDFTIEFWLYPLNMENGERVMSWVSTISPGQSGGNYVVQRIQCITSRNRLHWSFVNFFTATDNTAHINIEFSANTPVVPRTWSHHLIRFDASAGMIEYLVDGVSEAIVYATATGRESSEVYTPITGNNGFFRLGENFTGLMDEFKIHSAFTGHSSTQKFPSGGRIETLPFDLGENSSIILRVNVTGGRTGSVPFSSGRRISGINEFRENERFRFIDDSEMDFFIRTGENQFLLHNSPWISFIPGADISGLQGRYAQIAVDFYPSAGGETSPYLESIALIYLPGEPPLPPRNVTAVAVDGGVQLRWRHSPNTGTAGYLVYYSTVRGEFFGNGAALGPSPIDVGMTNSVFINGLENGTLYFFRVAAYDRSTNAANFNVGEFSAEVTARPLSSLQLSVVQ
jgi:hypothetical protein